MCNIICFYKGLKGERVEGLMVVIWIAFFWSSFWEDCNISLG